VCAWLSVRMLGSKVTFDWQRLNVGVL